MAQIAEGVVRAEVPSAFPKYRRIIDALAGAIEHGTLSPGDRLPPETSMARLFSVSLGTVQKALAHLADSGALHRTRRRGTFVAGRQADDVFVFRFRNPETGTVLVPFTRVLSVTEDRSEGPLARAPRTPSAACAWTGSSGWRAIHRASASSTSRSSTAGISWTSRSRNLHGVSFHRVLGERFNLPTVRTSHRLQCRQLCPAACRQPDDRRRNVRTVWDVVGFSQDQATSYQSIQIPAGHRPIELEAASTTARIGR
jgi:DNA-binding GntR family transcriptional regulator